LADVGPWFLMAFGMCALLDGAGTAVASPTNLWVVTPIAVLEELFPGHPFDLIYNYSIRYLRNTGSLPKHGRRVTSPAVWVPRGW